ncbi:OLC1v1016728C1 [Oldenlandia corymbosa var. corymbosa]|uniref:Protein TIC 22, chloroplastic n=1 Tax=Oldenlandia corymbosa var. corymbosa TaxID=529605 RepID=A0AAV1E7T6_OLDCO|nr:OLC1v1016728C1 [Oldenlandia corymbosa var. corymbosa]
MAQALMIKSQSSETVTFFLLRPPTFLHKISSFKKRITEMEPPASSVGPAPNPFQSLSAFIQQQTCRLGAELASRLDETKRFTSKFAANFPAVKPSHASASPLLLPFASVTKSQPPATREGKVSSANSASAAAAATPTLSSDYVAKTLAGTSVYTVSNTNNEFVLISDPNSAKSIGLLCFRYEDAQAFLAQVRSTKGGLRGGAKVVPITLEQVYMLKVEGIAFRFLPDPVQIKNALELKASDTMSGFDGVPVFQSDLLVVKKKKRLGNEILMRIVNGVTVKRCCAAHCGRQSVDLKSIAFLFDGRRLCGEQTPDELEMEDGDEIDAAPADWSLS